MSIRATSASTAAINAVTALSMYVGPIVVDPPVLLAPMAAVTDLPFRRLARRLGAAMETSEMIACREAVLRTEGSLKKASRSTDGAVMAVQLAGHDPAIMADAARLGADDGANIIDLNFFKIKDFYTYAQ